MTKGGLFKREGQTPTRYRLPLFPRTWYLSKVADPTLHNLVEAGPSRRNALILLFLASVLALAPLLPLPFIQDDWGVIVHNQDLTLENLPHIAGRAYWDQQLAFEDPWRPGHYLYRPLTVMMFAVEKSVFGSKAWAFRLSNLLLHIASACLVFTLVVRILAGSSTGRQSAMASALLFAVHAVHFETVLHIVGRAELGMTAAVLAALVFADKADKDRRWFGATLAAGMLAVLFKEQGLLCPFLVMGYAAFKAEPWGRATMVKYACLTFVWSGAYLLARDHAIQGYRPQDTILLPLLDYPFWERAAIMASGLVEYLRLMIWPVDPLLDYHHLVATSPRSFAALWPLLGVLIGSVCLLTLILGVWLKRPLAIVGAGLIIMGLGPVSNLFFPIGAVIAERFLYLPSAGVCILIAGLLQGRLHRKPMVGLLGLFIVFMIFLCWHHTYSFRDPLLLAFRMAERHPEAPSLQNMAALTFERYGRLDSARRAWLQQKEVDPEAKEADIGLGRLIVREISAEHGPFLPDGRHDLGLRLRQHLDRLKSMGNYREAPLVRARIHVLLREFDQARIEFLGAALTGGRSSSVRRQAAIAILELEKQGIGSSKLSPELETELLKLVRPTDPQ